MTTSRFAETLEWVFGTRNARPLEKLGLHTVEDLLRYYPREYVDFRVPSNLADLAPGDRVTVVARISSTVVRRNASGRGARLITTLSDGVATLELVFFSAYAGALRGHEAALVVGKTGAFSGIVNKHGSQLQIPNPSYEMVGDDPRDKAAALDHAAHLTPLYRGSTTFDSGKVSTSVRVVLDPLTPGDVEDILPEEFLAKYRLAGLFEALKKVHRPRDFAEANWALRRLRWEEAFVLQTALARRRLTATQEGAVPRQPVADGLLAAFDASLPFELTGGQQRVGAEISADLSRPYPMQRLLQGEVGSGKTLVALRAMLQVIDAGGQAAFLAPTEVLAVQHFRSLRNLLGPLAEGGMLGGAEQGTHIVLLTGSQPTAVRRRALLAAASGEAGIVVGTHALLSENVQLADLGLVVVDEQHRFGVEQRDALRAKERSENKPHMLVMTATPIPRTVAMTVFGDLEISTLTEIPAGRAPVATHVVPLDKPAWLARAWQRVQEEVAAGNRAFIVCPRIGGDESEPATGDEDLEELPIDADAPARPTAVLDLVEKLRAEPVLAGIDIGVLHGRLSPDEKDAAMTNFISGKTPVLVATTVIEVGVDVPAATAMVIMDADRYGISQLHQLRGRIGRGALPGVCLLVSGAPADSPARERLERVAATSDGFELAQYDLEARREGDVLGTAQSGATSLRLLRAARDITTIEEARAAATQLLADDPDLAQHPALARAVAQIDPQRAEFLDRS